MVKSDPDDPVAVYVWLRGAAGVARVDLADQEAVAR
jgi:hypothetical protein